MPGVKGRSGGSRQGAGRPVETVNLKIHTGGKAMNIERIVKATDNLHTVIADEVFPEGAILKCKKCDYTQIISPADCANYLQNGWPKHCAQTMLLETKTTIG